MVHKGPRLPSDSKRLHPDDRLLMQRAQWPRDTQRCDGIAGPTAVRTASLRLPRLQHPVRALCPRRQADHHRSFDRWCNRPIL